MEMPRWQRPGNVFCMGVLGGALAVHWDWNGWLIALGTLAIGWALNEEERKERERLGG